MSREIRFRAQGVAGGLYYFSLYQVQGIDISGEFFFVELDDGQAVNLICGTEEQFTGLKDKNGREIYEGDIIDTFDPIKLEQSQDDDVLGVVRYGLDRGYYFLEVDGQFYQLLRNLESPGVIGNLYENPDLLPS